jgi:hypothetical protein
MTRIQESEPRTIREIARSVQRVTRDCATLEEAVQRYTELLFQQFTDSFVLVRMFATGFYRDLPAVNRGFVADLAASSGVGAAIHDETLTLSLLGTSGVEPEWNDRRQSRGHVGIPLVSAAFVDAIPMVARLLSELGLGFDWLDQGGPELVVKTLGSVSGVFHVADAATAVDDQGRKIIPAQDFVAKYGVRTVFGIGGAYIGTPTFLVAIYFCRDEVTRAQAEEFVAHINRIKASTMELVHAGKIFAP